jgi:copper chaperone CopZ
METKINVIGMTCDHCINAVTDELTKIPSVTEVKIDLDSGVVDITSDSELDQLEITTAIEEAGYELK